MTDVLTLAETASMEALDDAHRRVVLQVLDAVERELAQMGAGYADSVVRLSEAYRHLVGGR
jgi:hypothetical protein